MATLSIDPPVIQVVPFEYDYSFDNAVCNFRRMVQYVCDDISKKAPMAASMLLRQKMIANGDCVKSLAAKLGIPRAHLRKVIKYGSVLRGEYYAVLAQYLGMTTPRQLFTYWKAYRVYVVMCGLPHDRLW